MRRCGYAHAGRRSRRIQRIRQQVVVPEILVPPKQYTKVVPFVLVEAQARYIVRIAAITKIAEVEVVEQKAVVIERAHIQRVIKETQARTEIHKRIVSIHVPIDRASPPPRLDGLLDVVVSRILSGSFSWDILCL